MRSTSCGTRRAGVRSWPVRSGRRWRKTQQSGSTARVSSSYLDPDRSVAPTGRTGAAMACVTVSVAVVGAGIDAVVGLVGGGSGTFVFYASGAS